MTIIMSATIVFLLTFTVSHSKIAGAIIINEQLLATSLFNKIITAEYLMIIFLNSHRNHML